MARDTRMQARRFSFSVVVGERRAGRGQRQRRNGHKSDDQVPQTTNPRLSALTIRWLWWFLLHDNDASGPENCSVLTPFNGRKRLPDFGCVAQNR